MSRVINLAEKVQYFMTQVGVRMKQICLKNSI